MRACARCGHLNDDFAKYCNSCGTTLEVPPPSSPRWSGPAGGVGAFPATPANSTPASGYLATAYVDHQPGPWTPPPPTPPILGIRGPKVSRYWSTFAVGLVGLILVGVSIALAWLTISVAGFTGSYYVLGTICVNGACVAAPSMPAALVAAEVLVIVALVLGIIGVCFAILGALGVTLRGSQAKVTSICAGLSFASALAAPATFAAYSYYNNSGLWSSPNTAGAGWYISLVAGILFIVMFAISTTARHEQIAVAVGSPYPPPPAMVPVGMAPAPPSYSYQAPPPAAGPAPPSPPQPSTTGAPAGMRYCGMCGAPNYPNATTCARCNARVS